jgi:AraC-like DNA-binding protein
MSEVFVFEERAAPTPLVETIWRTASERAGAFTSVAVSRWELVVTRRRGETRMTLRGPETRASRAPIPSDAEFLGIVFTHGTFMPALPVERLVDQAIHLPNATGRTFWLNGSAVPFPTFENADAFVARLVRAEALVQDRLVAAALRGEPSAVTPRTVRRRVLRATGLTRGQIRQIDRARQAAALLQQVVSVADTVEAAGYYDQPHLGRALRRLMGFTPTTLLRLDGQAPMSLSYKTHEFRHAKDRRDSARR